MKHSVIFAALGLAACGVAAQESGTVISSTPVVQQVPVCGQGYVARPGPTTGGGAVIGAITGAAIGSTFGGGPGQAAAIGIGAIAGGAVGNSIEANNNARMVPTCATPVSYENRTVAYNVTYEYNGRRYQAQLPTDPGPTIRLRITPAGEVRPMMRMYRGPAMAGAPVTAPPVQYAQRQRPMHMQQPMPQHHMQQPQHHMQQPQQHMQMQQPQHPIVQQQPAPDIARNYGEAVPPEQERQGTNWSATESGNAVLAYGHPHAYGYGYPAYPATYGYPAYPAYGYAYPPAVGVAVLPAYRPFYRPWVGYRPWGGYYRPWGYRPRVSIGVGFGWRGGWR